MPVLGDENRPPVAGVGPTKHVADVPIAGIGRHDQPAAPDELIVDVVVDADDVDGVLAPAELRLGPASAVPGLEWAIR